MLVRTAPQCLVAENKKGREPSGARPLAIPLGKSAKSRAWSNRRWWTGDQAASRWGCAPANAHRPPRSRFRASLCNLALSARTSSLLTYAPFVGSSSFFLYANAYSNLPKRIHYEIIQSPFPRRRRVCTVWPRSSLVHHLAFSISLSSRCSSFFCESSTFCFIFSGITSR